MRFNPTVFQNKKSDPWRTYVDYGQFGVAPTFSCQRQIIGEIFDLVHLAPKKRYMGWLSLRHESLCSWAKRHEKLCPKHNNVSWLFMDMAIVWLLGCMCVSANTRMNWWWFIELLHALTQTGERRLIMIRHDDYEMKKWIDGRRIRKLRQNVSSLVQT
jgi:hypothetical protein